MVKSQMKKGFPPIKQREKIYMKREHPEISLEYIKTLLIKIYDKEIILKNFENSNQPEREPLDEKIKAELPLWAQKLKKEEKKLFQHLHCNFFLIVTLLSLFLQIVH